MTNHIDILVDKSTEFVTQIDGQNTWNAQQRELFRRQVIRYLRRHPDARNDMINAPKSVNNTYAVLEHFSKHFVMSFPYVPV